MVSSTTTREREVKTLGEHYRESLKARYGEKLAQGNVSCIPHTIIDNFAKAGLTDGELAFWFVVQRYQFDAALPWPSVENIAETLQKSRRTVERRIGRLIEKGFLVVTKSDPNEAGYCHNYYDFRPFYDRVLMVALHLEVPPIPKPERKPKPVEVAQEVAPAPEPAPAKEEPCIECEEEAQTAPPSPVSPRLPEVLDRRIGQLSNEFNDAQSTKSNKTRIADLLDEWVSAGLDEEQFAAGIEEIAGLTRQAKRITRHNKHNSKPTRMPYFFDLLKKAYTPAIAQAQEEQRASALLAEQQREIEEWQAQHAAEQPRQPELRRPRQSDQKRIDVYMRRKSAGDKDAYAWQPQRDTLTRYLEDYQAMLDRSDPEAWRYELAAQQAREILNGRG